MAVTVTDLKTYLRLPPDSTEDLSPYLSAARSKARTAGIPEFQNNAQYDLLILNLASLYYDQQGPAFYIHNFYMIHVPFVSTNGITGINPVSVLFDTLKYADSIQTFSVSQLEQGVNAAIVLEAPANLGNEQKTDMVESFMQTYRETSGNILLLESGVTAKTLNLSPVDTNLLEVEKITRSKVAMVYNIPPFRYTAGGFAYNPPPKPGVGRFCAPPRPKESGRLWHLRCKLRPPHALFVIRRT